MLFASLVGLAWPAAAQVAPQIEWQKPLGGTGMDLPAATVRLPNGGYLVAGTTRSTDGDVTSLHGNKSDVWLVQLDALGQLLWQKTYGGSWDETAAALQRTSDGGSILAGTARSSDGDVSGLHGSPLAGDAWVVKFDADGGIQWQRALGGSDQDAANAVQQTADGGYVVAGWTRSSDGDVGSNHGIQDAWIVKLDADGGTEWKRSLGGSGTDAATSILQTDDGGYIVAGYSDSDNGDASGLHGEFDGWLVKLGPKGMPEWHRMAGGHAVDQFLALDRAPGGYIAAGISYSDDGDVAGSHGNTDGWVVRFNTAGDIVWQQPLGGSLGDWITAVRTTSDGGYVVAGYTGSTDGDVVGNDGWVDIWVVKLKEGGAMHWQTSLGGRYTEEAASIEITPDNGYILSGYAESNDGDVSGNHTDAFGERDIWVVKLRQPITAGVQEHSAEAVTIVPNPSNGRFRVDLSAPADGWVAITDMVGREVRRERVTGPTCTVDLSDQARGCYLLTLRLEQGTHTQRIMLQ